MMHFVDSHPRITLVIILVVAYLTAHLFNSIGVWIHGWNPNKNSEDSEDSE